VIASLLVATDLDSCLLDESYRHDAADAALAALRRAGVPLVLASSKTRAEMEPLWRELRLEAPFVVENGGALLWPEDPGDARAVERDGLFVLSLGVPRRRLVAELRAIALESGAQLAGFADMAPEQVAALTGLSPAAARRAADRDFDEPFLCEPEDRARVEAAAGRRGLRITRGGRFHHLSGPVDKGDALRELLRIWEGQGRRYSSVGLGDAPNDLGLLRAVDRPIVIPRPDGEPDPMLRAALPAAERAPRPGPAGWNAALLAVLRGDRLAQVQA